MPKTKYRDVYYIYSYKKGQFLRSTRADHDGGRVCFWTDDLRKARVYVSQTCAKRLEYILNEALGGRPCKAVGSLLAESLDGVNRRNRAMEADKNRIIGG